MANERIIACGTYCYDSKNTMEMEMSFRSAVSESYLKVDGMWEDESGVWTTYGLKRWVLEHRS